MQFIFYYRATSYAGMISKWRPKMQFTQPNEIAVANGNINTLNNCLLILIFEFYLFPFLHCAFYIVSKLPLIKYFDNCYGLHILHYTILQKERYRCAHRNTALDETFPGLVHFICLPDVKTME